MNKLDQEFFEELEKNIEATLESWMENNLKRPMEDVIIRHLTDFNKTVMSMEGRHRRRWMWVMSGFAGLIITNIILVVVTLW